LDVLIGSAGGTDLLNSFVNDTIWNTTPMLINITQHLGITWQYSFTKVIYETSKLETTLFGYYIRTQISIAIAAGVGQLAVSNGGISAKFGAASLSLDNEYNLQLSCKAGITDEWAIYTGMKFGVLTDYVYSAEVYSPKGSSFAVKFETYCRNEPWKAPVNVFGAEAVAAIAAIGGPPVWAAITAALSRMPAFA